MPAFSWASADARETVSESRRTSSARPLSGIEASNDSLSLELTVIPASSIAPAETTAHTCRTRKQTAIAAFSRRKACTARAARGGRTVREVIPLIIGRPLSGTNPCEIPGPGPTLALREKNLCDLDTVQGRALSDIVGHNPEAQSLLAGDVFTYSADKDRIRIGGF